MRRFFNLFVIIFSLGIINISCENTKKSIYNRLKGQWAIEEIKYSDKNYKDNLYSNALIFKDDNKISIPESVHFKKDKNSSWDLIESESNKFLIKINTSSIVFNDTFSVEFIIEKEKKLRGVILKSDTIYIKAYKLLQNFDRW